MGTYYRYVNHTRGEFVDPGSILADGSRGERAILLCGRALAYLMMPPLPPQLRACEFRGRWGSPTRYLGTADDEAGGDVDLERTRLAAQAVAVVADSDVDFDGPGGLNYVDITAPLVAEMRYQGACPPGDPLYSVVLPDARTEQTRSASTPAGRCAFIRALRDEIAKDPSAARAWTLTRDQIESLLLAIDDASNEEA